MSLSHTQIRALVAAEFDRFFEFTTDDRSIVTSTSAKLFAEHIAAAAALADLGKPAGLLETMVAAFAEHIQTRRTPGDEERDFMLLEREIREYGAALQLAAQRQPHRPTAECMEGIRNRMAIIQATTWMTADLCMRMHKVLTETAVVLKGPVKAGDPPHLWTDLPEIAALVANACREGATV